MRFPLLTLYLGLLSLVSTVAGDNNETNKQLPYLFEQELEDILHHPINATGDALNPVESGIKVVFVYVTESTFTSTASETVITVEDTTTTDFEGAITTTTVTDGTTTTVVTVGGATTEAGSSDTTTDNSNDTGSTDNSNEASGATGNNTDNDSDEASDGSEAGGSNGSTSSNDEGESDSNDSSPNKQKPGANIEATTTVNAASPNSFADKTIGGEEGNPDALFTYTDADVQGYNIGIDTSNHGPTFIPDQDKYEAYSTSTSNPVTEAIPLPDSSGPTANFDLIDDIVPTTSYFLYMANFTSHYKYPTATGNSSSTTQRNPLATEGLKVPKDLGSAYINTATLTKGVEISNLGDGKTSKIFVEESSTSSYGRYLNSTLSSATYKSESTDSESDDDFHNFDIDEYNRLHPDDNSTIETFIYSDDNSTSLGKRATANGFTGDLFQPISTSDVSSKFPRKSLPLSIPSGVSNSVKYQTNKFYVNLFLGDQTDMIWSYPYGLQWTKSTYYGFAVQHTIISSRVFGDNYYFNPINIKEMIISATSFTASKIKMNVSNMKVMTATVKLSTDGNVKTNYIEIPVVQGMGMVTSIYHGNLVPRLNSAVGFKTFVSETSTNLKSNVLKYRAILFSETQYLIYVTLPSGVSKNSFKLSVKDSHTINGSKAINGIIIQMAEAPPKRSQDMFYDSAAGKYVIEGKLKAHVYSGERAEYRFSYNTKGSSKSGKPMVFALQHHYESFLAETKKGSTGIKLACTTKGDMYGYLSTEMVINENFNLNIQMLPWTQQLGSKALKYTSNQLQIMAKVANTELSVDIPTLVNSANSNYFSGKIIDKYAYIMYVVCDIVGNKSLCKSALAQLKSAFAIFTSNKQYYPLFYDTKFGGITSQAALGGDSNADFGSSYYNDHHFHYGYFVHAAALVGYIDKKVSTGKWVQDNKWWVDALVRDVANPSPDDPHFPIFRMYDFFAGHSWASGLFAGGDGRNQESTSEDYNFAYGMKLWGKVSGNKRMESVGDLMLAVMKRSMNKYYLYSSSNKLEPSKIVANKVAGILFDNKIDYTTYFGDKMQYIHGIHMLPITPASSNIRGPTFVKEEWSAKIAKSINSITDGWAGILRLNQVLFDPASSYSFFSSKSFKSQYLDNGLSRTWALAFGSGVKNVV